MYNNDERTQLEFIFKKNDNIICHRDFKVNNFNKDALNSYDLKTMMDKLCGTNNGRLGTLGIIPNHFKSVSEDYIWEMYKNYYNVKLSNQVELGDTFTLQVIYNSRVVAESSFSGDYFPTVAKYHINIKDIIPKIISEIMYTFSKRKYDLVN
jgi:hypothetical protein